MPVTYGAYIMAILKIFKAAWGELTGYARLLLVMAVVIAAGYVYLKWDSSTDEQYYPANSWEAPVGYKAQFTVDTDDSVIRLWTPDHGADVCYLLEEADVDGHTRSAFGGCGSATEAEWGQERDVGVLVFTPPRAEGTSVMVTLADGTRLGPFPVRGGMTMIKDNWPHLPVRLKLQALDANGKALGPAKTVNVEAT